MVSKEINTYIAPSGAFLHILLHKTRKRGVPVICISVNTDWLTQHQSIIAVSIAVIGWLVQYLLNVRAQRKNYLNQINDEARKTITKELISYQDWLHCYHQLVPKAKLILEGVVGDWRSFGKEVSDMTSVKLEWIYILEEYEILFPETRCLREELLERDREIVNCLGQIFKLTWSLDEADKERIVHMLEEKTEFVADQIAFIEHLKIHLQNKTLNLLTGNKVPEIKPLDPLLPIVIYDKGQLKIKQRKK